MRVNTPVISGRSSRLEAIGAAAAGIAHDINNHLTLIVNHLAIDDMDGARNAAQSCSELTEALLSFCRGGLLETEEIDLSVFVASFVRRLELAESMHIRLELNTGQGKVLANRGALGRVLENLISNACVAMEDEGLITVRATERGVEVQDSGPGVPMHLRERIFEPFFSTKGTHGSGLGLAIVRDLMRQMGGSVALLPQGEGGAHFALRFRPAGV